MGKRRLGDEVDRLTVELEATKTTNATLRNELTKVEFELRHLKDRMKMVGEMLRKEGE